MDRPCLVGSLPAYTLYKVVKARVGTEGGNQDSVPVTEMGGDRAV